MLETSHHIVLNSSSGAAADKGVTAAELMQRFAGLGHTVSIDADATRPFAERLQTARDSAAPILVAAGGDGTVTALAEAAIQAGKTLAIIPLGTANLMARDLAIPLLLDDWFASYDRLVSRKIDVGEVNGRMFLHKVVIGAIPGIAAAREQLRGRKDVGAMIGFLGHFVRRMSRVRRFAAEITPSHGEPHIERVQSIAVANNDYDEGAGRFFSRSRLDRGTLSLYLLHHLNAIDAFRLGIEMLLGRWRQDEALEIGNVHSLVIRTRGRSVRVMIDGEVEMLPGPLGFRSVPQALRVLALPQPETVSETDEKVTATH